MKKIVRYKLETDEAFSLTEAQMQEIEALKKMADSEIDTYDIAQLEDDFLKGAINNPFYKPRKLPTTIRLDADILNWLKSQGKGYQTRINNILREAMVATYKVKE